MSKFSWSSEYKTCLNPVIKTFHNRRAILQIYLCEKSGRWYFGILIQMTKPTVKSNEYNAFLPNLRHESYKSIDDAMKGAEAHLEENIDKENPWFMNLLEQLKVDNRQLNLF